MALLDVSEVIEDPLFTSPVTLVTMAESFDLAGNPVWHEDSSATVDAVVTSDMKSIARLPEALRREGTIVVRFMVPNAPEGFYGHGYDRVIWRGKKFVVKDCADYTQFGRGFLRLICHPEEITDGSY